MSKDMELVIKEKYSNFIKIVSDTKELSPCYTDKKNKRCSPVEELNISCGKDSDKPSEYDNIFIKLESIINSNTKQPKTVNVITVTKPSNKKKNHNVNSDTNEEKQFQKLEMLYDQEINNPNTKPESKITYNDELKNLCLKFEEKCIMESTRGFNISSDMYYININLLIKNIVEFNKQLANKYECVVFYKKYGKTDKNIEWLEISSGGEKNVSSKNKYLSACVRLLESGNKFKKTISGTKTRGFKLSFMVWKTNYKIDIFALGKELST
jgi:hypothetical protein